MLIRTDEGAPRFRMCAAPLSDLRRSNWAEIVPEDPEGAVLKGFKIVGGYLILLYSHNVTSRIEMRTLEGELVRHMPMPGRGLVYSLSGTPRQSTLYYSFQSLDRPWEVCSTTIPGGQSRLVKRTELPYRPEGMAVEQVFYDSIDGTRVPMFLLYKKRDGRSQPRPTVTHAYGAFGSSYPPVFDPKMLLWAEQGGLSVIANVRGGGEFGSDWHRAGRRENKQNTFDDIIAAARWLVKTGRTTPDRLAVWGGSAGGLAVAAVITQHPELFRAAVAGVPVFDVLRYREAGGLNVTEYGDPEKPEEFAWLYSYAPYQRVRRGTRYPSILVLSANQDARVSPMHSYKFVAAFSEAQAAPRPILLRVRRDAGHHGSAEVAENLQETADALAFLWRELNGPCQAD